MLEKIKKIKISEKNTIKILLLLIDINHLRNVWEDRIEYMETNNSEGQIVFEQYYTDNMKNPNYGISDLYEDETEWPNYEIACYYGVEDREITIPSKD